MLIDVSLAGPVELRLGRIVERADRSRSTAFERSAALAVSPGAGGFGVGAATGKRGVWSTANAGVQPKSGNIPPQPVVRNCWTIWYSVDRSSRGTRPPG